MPFDLRNPKDARVTANAINVVCESFVMQHPTGRAILSLPRPLQPIAWAALGVAVIPAWLVLRAAVAVRGHAQGPEVQQ